MDDAVVENVSSVPKIPAVTPATGGRTADGDSPALLKEAVAGATEGTGVVTGERSYREVLLLLVFSRPRDISGVKRERERGGFWSSLALLLS